MLCFESSRTSVAWESTLTHDSDVAIDLDRAQTERLSPQLHLTIHPSTRHQRMVRIQTEQDLPDPNPGVLKRQFG